MPDSALPPNLRGKTHNDYPWGLRWIPRGWTAFKWGVPRLVAGKGNTCGFLESSCPSGHWACDCIPLPIGRPGSWQLSRFPGGPWYAWYFAFTTKGGTHFRIGARWDDVDDYVEAPVIAIKRGIV